SGLAWATGIALALEAAIYVFVLGRVTGFRFGVLVGESWRCATATAGMVLILVSLDLAWSPAAATMAGAVTQVGIAAAVGAGVYSVLLMALWALTGCPDGPEATLVHAIGRRLPLPAFGRRAT
ncbi:MAG: polysaccharide biosynthesis C-terminal domain-containing protein, partial [Stellaceae bacterium]